MSVSIVLMAVNQRSEHLTPVRSVLSLAVYPIQYLVSLPDRFGHQMMDSFSEYKDLLEENRRLKEEQLVYKTRLLKFSALEKENIRLRNLLDSSFKLGEQVLVGELLAVNLDPYKQTVLVDKGTRFGVFVGQPVLDANGVVGQVYRANPLNSEIVLISDPSHALPVQVNRNGLRTIAVGNGRINELSLPFLPNNVDIEVGDLIITSGLGGTFPQGYPVGTITEVTPQPEKPFSRITAKPSAHLDRSRELLLVWSNQDPLLPLPAKPENPEDHRSEHEVHE
ncbi:MAG: rod shape-determining protein MreC [Methylococcaceae bacterium]|nr:rod shape-determining protein MreC [Methylococcaceae bacterium]